MLGAPFGWPFICSESLLQEPAPCANSVCEAYVVPPLGLLWLLITSTFFFLFWYFGRGIALGFQSLEETVLLARHLC